MVRMQSRSELFGLLNVDKPTGWTSRKVVDQVQRLVRPAKVGHAGTLDPLAGGVLIVCIGPATRLVPYLHEWSKSYRGEFLLGRTSNTDDIEGIVTELEDAPPVTREQLLEVLPRFVGRITQTPPAYSAVKIEGQRAYKLARKGHTPDVKPREVEVSRLDLVEFDPPRFVLEIDCSTGTYIRSLGRDIARAADSEAVMSALVRTRIGPFERETAVSPGELTSDSIGKLILPASMAVSHLPRVECTDQMFDDLQHGRPVPCPSSLDLRDRDRCAVITSEERLVAIVEYRADHAQLAPCQVFR